MKKLFLLLTVFAVTRSNAQLNKGAQMAGIQFNLAVHDIYSAHFHIASNAFGLSVVPTYGYAIGYNWLLGVQATFGYERIKDPMLSPYQQTTRYTDIGIAPFTRYYLDLTANKKFKFFGQAGLDINNTTIKTTYTGGSAPSSTSYSNTGTVGSLGGGLAYFGKKIVIDASGSTSAVRIGIYKMIGGKK